MKKLFLLIPLLWILIPAIASAQEEEINDEDTVQTSDYYSIEDSLLIIYDEDGNEEDTIAFESPEFYLVDLDGDETDELLVIDAIPENDAVTYLLYVYAVDSLVVEIDVLNSGHCEPEFDFNDELNSNLLSIGYPELDSLYESIPQDTIFYPRRFFAYDGEELVPADGELYTTFEDENNEIINYIKNSLSENSVSCDGAKPLRSAVFTAFLNYRKIGSISIANKFFERYYPCDDKNTIKKLLEQ